MRMPSLYSLIYLIDVAGVVLFATLLWNTRARIPGLVAFALSLLTIVGLARPDMVPTDSWWMVLFRGRSLTELGSLALLLGAVYALRDAPSAGVARLEGFLVRALAFLTLVGFVASLFVGALPIHLVIEAVTVGVALLAALGLAIRFGSAPASLAGMAGFALIALGAALAAAFNWQPDLRESVPTFVLPALFVLGKGAAVAGFGLAASYALVQREPYPGVSTLGMNGTRYVGLFLILFGVVLFSVLLHLVGDSGMGFFRGLRGRAAAGALVLLALPLVGAVRGAVRVSTGRAG
jgi:hypothetical protein